MSLLSNIFGSKLTALLPLLARLFGLNKDSAGSLLGILGPILMSVLSKQQSASNLDASGLANLLAANRDQVDAALPPEIKQELGFGQPAPAAAPPAAGANPLKGLIPLLAAAAIAFLAWKYWPSAAPNGPGELPNVEVPSVETMTTTATASLGGLTEAIGSITDEESARGALDKINAARETFNNLSVDKLPAAAQSTFGGGIAPLIEKLRSVLETAYTIPGVRDIIEPVVGPLLEKLDGFVG